MLADLMRFYRRRLDLTQEQLAEATGLSIRGIRKIESGCVSRPRRSTVQLLAYAFQLAGAELEQFERGAGITNGQVASPMWSAEPARIGTLSAQLPAAVAGFVGRTAALQALDDILVSAQRQCTTPGATVAAIVGMAGIGKTALAVHWGHKTAAQFPSGQLYVNLHGFHPDCKPMPPSDAVRVLLDALQAPVLHAPPTLDGQYRLYRRLMAGKRMLVLLDNARDADQVRPLLPGMAGSLAIVTSRTRLTGLAVTDNARLVDLEPLRPHEARQLLEHRIGAERVAVERRAVEEVVGCCAQLPLALAIWRAYAATRPELPLTELAGRLHDIRSRLDVLTGGEAHTNIRESFDQSYRTLTPDAARMFRLLGQQAAAEVSVVTAATLSGVSRVRAYRLLDELTNAHMVTERTPHRYAMHDLLRAYASELAEHRLGSSKP